MFIFGECLYLVNIYIWRIFTFKEHSYLEDSLYLIDIHTWGMFMFGKHLYLEDISYKTL
jgi:hypothetical protein